MAYVDIGCALALTSIFGFSAWSKLKSRASFASFKREVHRMGVPRRLSNAAAFLVVSGEVGAPLLLLSPWAISSLMGYAASTALLASFTIGIVASLRRGDNTPCQCFGRSTVPLGRRHVVRNLALIAVAVLGAAAVSADSSVADPGIAVVAGLAGLVAGGLVTVADDLAAIISPASTSRH